MTKEQVAEKLLKDNKLHKSEELISLVELLRRLKEHDQTNYFAC